MFKRWSDEPCRCRKCVARRRPVLTIDDKSEPGAWAEAIPYLPSQQTAGETATPGRHGLLNTPSGKE